MHLVFMPLQSQELNRKLERSHRNARHLLKRQQKSAYLSYEKKCRALTLQLSNLKLHLHGHLQLLLTAQLGSMVPLHCKLTIQLVAVHPQLVAAQGGGKVPLYCSLAMWIHLQLVAAQFGGPQLILQASRIGSVLIQPCSINSNGKVGSQRITMVQKPRISSASGKQSVTLVQSPHINCTSESRNNQPGRISLVQSPCIGQSSNQSCSSNSPLQQQQQPPASVLAGLLQQILPTAGNSSQSSSTPPLQPPPQIESNHLFWVMFLVGNISRCQGCGEKIEKGPNGKVLPPPNDLVVQHKEQVMFQNPNTGHFSCHMTTAMFIIIHVFGA